MIMKSRDVGWTGNVARMGCIIYAYEIVVMNHDGNKPQLINGSKTILNGY